MSRITVADTIKKIIADKGLKQYIVAERCGYSGKRFSDLLNGRKRITEQDIFKLCNGLEIQPNELFGYGETV